MKKRFNILTVVSLMLLVSALTFSITYIFVQDTFNKQLEDQSTQGKLCREISQVSTT